MDRRTFLKRTFWLAGGAMIVVSSPVLADVAAKAQNGELTFDNELYKLFKNPEPSRFNPFVRWWWNGNKVCADELVRELHLLKNAGVGGVEINPIRWPAWADDHGIPSLLLCSDEWIEMLQVTFDEVKKLGMTCDLLVGSGFPFGSIELEGEERAQAVYIHAEEVEGPSLFEIPQTAIYESVDPAVTDPNPTRTFETLSLKLTPETLGSLDEVIDLSEKKNDEVIRIKVPEGKHVFYALVKIEGFANILWGAPGHSGPILNHFDAQAVRKFLNNIADKIESKTGPLKDHIRAFFSDSVELEGSNWTRDFGDEFKTRRGYDMMPYLPFILSRVGRLGAVIEGEYGAKKTPEFQALLDRMRFDFELTKAELTYERFIVTFADWCHEKGVAIRMQGYGRGLFQLENSMLLDYPEGESWTMNYLRHKLGEEMGDEDYRRGRGYTHINKYVSSGAHLAGKRIVSCEEMTNTYRVFNASLELLKIGSDMSIVSGITHSVWHGFSYSPPEIPFPGWVQYDFNHLNNFFPWMHYLNRYKGRVSSQLQNADMYTDIALLTATYDLWSERGVQTDPFPEGLTVPYTSLVWEAIHKNGGACDYTTENIINRSEVRGGKLCYGPKAYGTLFLVGVNRTQVSTLEKLYEFISQGGRVFCIGTYPNRSLGLQEWEKRDGEIRDWVDKLKTFPDRFVLLEKPEDDCFLEWYHDAVQRYNIPRYVKIENPDRFLTQIRYVRDDGSELFFFLNSHMHEGRRSHIVFAPEITHKRFPWIWDPETGEKYRIEVDRNGSYELDMGPAESRLIIFDKTKKGEAWHPLPDDGPGKLAVKGWTVDLHHSVEGWIKSIRMDDPVDLAETDYVNFTGEATYRTVIELTDPTDCVLNLGKVWGISELRVNGQDCGVKWFGRRIYDIGDALQRGANSIEIKVITTMGNYVRTLTDNRTAIRFTGKYKDEHEELDRVQETQSMGIVGPVTLYRSGKRA